MKITFEECNGQFCLAMIPETLAEASKLARLGMNHTKRKTEIYVSAGKETISGSVYIQKPKQERTYIRRTS